MNINQTDSFDGNEPGRQMMILITHISVLIASFVFITLLQFGILAIVDLSLAISYLTSGAFLPLTFLLWILFSWWYLKDGYVDPQGNLIQATDNMWSRKHFADGSTCFTVYQKWGLTYKWERRQGKQIEVQKEKTFMGKDTLNVTIKKVALEMKPKVMYRVWLPRLSAFLQNIEDNSAVILGQLESKINQEVETYASMFASTEQVQQHQQTILDYVLGQVRDKYREHGIDVIEINFDRCDYSAKTQEELNKVLELTAMMEISKGMSQSDAEAFRTVAAAGGKSGVKLNVNRYEANAEFANAMDKIGPTGAILMGLNQSSQGGNK